MCCWDAWHVLRGCMIKHQRSPAYHAKDKVFFRLSIYVEVVSVNEHRSVPSHHILSVSMHKIFFWLYSVVTKESTMKFRLPCSGMFIVQFCGLYFVICLTSLYFGLSRIENVSVFVYYKIPFMNILLLLFANCILKAQTAICVMCSSGEISCYDGL